MEKNSINPHKLYKDHDHNFIAGICSGIADYFNTSRLLVRVLFILSFLINAILTTAVYIFLAIVLEKKPRRVFSDESEEYFWRGVSFTPRETFKNLKYKFLNVENRIRKMENYVTSSEFETKEKYKSL